MLRHTTSAQVRAWQSPWQSNGSAGSGDERAVADLRVYIGPSENPEEILPVGYAKSLLGCTFGVFPKRRELHSWVMF